jgi:hypothetical protein
MIIADATFETLQLTEIFFSREPSLTAWNWKLKLDRVMPKAMDLAVWLYHHLRLRNNSFSPC